MVCFSEVGLSCLMKRAALMRADVIVPTQVFVGGGLALLACSRVSEHTVESIRVFVSLVKYACIPCGCGQGSSAVCSCLTHFCRAHVYMAQSRPVAETTGQPGQPLPLAHFADLAPSKYLYLFYCIVRGMNLHACLRL